MNKYLLSVILLVALSTNAFADALDLPKTNIMMMDMKYSHGNFKFSNLKKIATSRNTYENQPRFTLDGTHILYAKEYHYRKAGSNTDICRYKLNGGKTSRLTCTPEYEFSPQEYKEGTALTAIRVDKDGNQNIAKYSLEGKFLRIEKLNNDVVGYYAWLNDQNVVIYALPDPVVLKWVNIYTNEEKPITSKIGHTVEFFPRDNYIYYVDNSTDNDWYIKRINVKNLFTTPETVVKTMPAVEDFAMMNDGSFITYKEGKLYHFAPGRMGEYNGKVQTDWAMIADLGRLEAPTSISRMAISPENDKFVFVVREDDVFFE